MDDPTIPANDRFIQYRYSGGSPTFNYDFPVYDVGSVAVYIGEHKLPPIDYIVTIGEQFSGGTVTLLNNPPSDALVTILGDTPIIRTEYYSDKSVVDPAALDVECDKTVMRLQQVNTKLLGCMRNTIDETELDNTTLPPTDDRRGHVAAWGPTGALSYIGDAAMDDLYLKRANNLSDLADVPAARNNLHIIDGRNFTNNGNPIPYRPTVEFDNGFKLVNELVRTVISLNIAVANVGAGLPIVTSFTGNTLWARNISAGDNVALHMTSDGAIQISAKFSPDEYFHTFGVTSWAPDNTVVIPPDQHGLGNDDRLLAIVRNRTGDDVAVDINVSGGGIVTLSANEPFPGYVIIFNIFPKFLQREYTRVFGPSSWGADNRITIPPDQHGLGNDDRLLCVVRDHSGDAVVVDINVSGGGIVTLTTNDPFSGYAIIFGGPERSHMFNPMAATGDIIFSENEYGTPARLPIGSPNQALCAGTDGIPQYTTLGECAWMHPNIPGGPVLLDDGGEVPAQYLPINTMAYMGTFGSVASTNGGDLPASGVLDGDIFIADSDYYSTVANMFFSAGEWAIFTGAGWSKVPSIHPSTAPVGSIIPYAGTAVPDHYLSCDGYQVKIADYQPLYAAIGTIYNTGSEPAGYFSIPNYNTNGQFLQGGTVPGAVRGPGLPNITGTIGYDSTAAGIIGGAFRDAGQYGGASGSSSNNRYAVFDASRSNPIYGSSDTVQPPATAVIFLIKYL